MIEIKVIKKPNLKRNFTFSKTELQQISKQANKGIKNRTNKGLDVKNQPFKPYSTEYKKNKRPKGNGKVNLRVSGKMINSIKETITKNKIILKATDPKAKYHQYKGAGRGKVVRRWFGIDFKLEKKIQKSFREFWKNKVKGKK